MDVKIRKAEMADSGRILKKLDEFDNYLAPLFKKELISFTLYKDKNKTFEKVLNEWLTNPEYIFFVAEENGNLIGHICGIIKENKLRIKDREGQIVEWFISEEFRHMGIGKKLYEVLVSEFKKLGCSHLALKVYTDNKETINMYHKMGFLDLELGMVKDL